MILLIANRLSQFKPINQYAIVKQIGLTLWNHWALQYLEKALAAIFEAKNMARIGPRYGRYFVLQDEVDPPPPVLLGTKHAWCVQYPPLRPPGHPPKLCELLLYSTCLSNSYGARIHFVHGSTSSCKTKYLPPLQVVTTDPKCDTKPATTSFAPLIWLKILFTRWPEKSNNLKILDFLKNIFILYSQRGGKRYFSLRVKARICYKCWRILLSGMCHATCICTLRIGLVFTESRRCLWWTLG